MRATRRLDQADDFARARRSALRLVPDGNRREFAYAFGRELARISMLRLFPLPRRIAKILRIDG